MLERLRGVWASLNTQPTTVKVILIVVAFALLTLLSQALMVVAVLVLFVSLFALVVRLLRRRPLKGWGIAALVSLVSIFVFSGIANAVYGPPEQPTQQQAAAPEPPKEEPKTASAETPEDEADRPEEVAEDTTTEIASTPPEPEDEQVEDEGERGGGYDATVTVTRVVDGDTIEIFPSIERLEEVRLIGVDTPETKDPNCAMQPYGPEATAYAVAELQGEEVGLEFDQDRSDRYRRLLAYVYLPDGEMFNEALLEEGYAQTYIVPPNDEYEERFLQAQMEAQANERGIWGLSASEQAQLADRDNSFGKDECQPKATPAPPPPPAPDPAPNPAPSPAPIPDLPSAPRPAPAVPQGGDVDCSDFGSSAEAQPYLLPGDPNRLDADGDGQACDSLG